MDPLGFLVPQTVPLSLHHCHHFHYPPEGISTLQYACAHAMHHASCKYWLCQTRYLHACYVYVHDVTCMCMICYMHVHTCYMLAQACYTACTSMLKVYYMHVEGMLKDVTCMLNVY